MKEHNKTLKNKARKDSLINLRSGFSIISVNKTKIYHNKQIKFVELKKKIRNSTLSETLRTQCDVFST